MVCPEESVVVSVGPVNQRLLPVWKANPLEFTKPPDNVPVSNKINPVPVFGSAAQPTHIALLLAPPPLTFLNVIP